MASYQAKIQGWWGTSVIELDPDHPWALAMKEGADMAGKPAAKKTAAKKQEPFVWFEESTGFYYIVDGKKKTNVGVNRRYAEKMLADATS
jgi:hypothetical protein